MKSLDNGGFGILLLELSFSASLFIMLFPTLKRNVKTDAIDSRRTEPSGRNGTGSIGKRQLRPPEPQVPYDIRLSSVTDAAVLLPPL